MLVYCSDVKNPYAKSWMTMSQPGVPTPIVKENETPVEVADDEAASDRAEHWADEAGNGDEAHGADEFGLRECAHHRQAADRNHHRAATTLEDAAGHKFVNVGGQAAEQRAEREDADGG